MFRKYESTSTVLPYLRRYSTCISVLPKLFKSIQTHSYSWLVGQDTTDADFSSLGQTGGSKTHTLLETEIPSHTHPFSYARPIYHSDRNSITGNQFTAYNVATTPSTTASTGGGQPHSIMNPYQVVLYYRRISWKSLKLNNPSLTALLKWMITKLQNYRPETSPAN